MNIETSASLMNQIYVENKRLYSKFGDIFFTTDCRCLFVCDACDRDFEYFDVFIQHIGMDHEFLDIFQNGPTKRFVCISNMVNDTSKDEELELIEEDTKDLIEYSEEEIKYLISDQPVNEELTTDGRLKGKVLEYTESSFSKGIVSHEKQLKSSNEVSVKLKPNRHDRSEKICDLCGKKFASENNLVRHKWRHSSQTQWSCPTCGKVTTTKDGMILHVRRKHTGEKPFKCKFCDKSFASASQRNLHHGVHTGYKPYVCEKCGKRFKLHTVLRYHMDWHMGVKKYKCEKCDKRFHSTSELNNHKSVHTWERPFQCTECNLRFKTKRHLQRHQEVHSGKLKMCKYCNKVFAHISTLTSHLRSHQFDEVE